LLFAAGVACVVYTLPSHTPERPRWRVLAPCSGLLEPARRQAMVARVNGVLGGILARESFTLSQAFYAGFVRANGHNHRVELVPGDAIDLCDDLDAIAIAPAGNGAGGDPSEAGRDEREDAELVRIIISGETGLHNALVALAARHIGRGTPSASVITILRGLMQAWAESARDDRWRKRRGEIPAIVASALHKFQTDTRVAFRECTQLL
jgi:hypothetical protein